MLCDMAKSAYCWNRNSGSVICSAFNDYYDPYRRPSNVTSPIPVNREPCLAVAQVTTIHSALARTARPVKQVSLPYCRRHQCGGRVMAGFSPFCSFACWNEPLQVLPNDELQAGSNAVQECDWDSDGAVVDPEEFLDPLQAYPFSGAWPLKVYDQDSCDSHQASWRLL